MPPSEYFKRQCYIALDVDEEPAVDVVNKMGADYFVVSTDYPHSDGAFPGGDGPVLRCCRSDDVRRKILWDNCARLYDIPRAGRRADERRRARRRPAPVGAQEGLCVHGSSRRLSPHSSPWRSPRPPTPSALVVSVWGGNWKDTVEKVIGKAFTARTGIPVEYEVGGTIDRLAKARVAKGNPLVDLNFTTTHVARLYISDGLYEELDTAEAPNAKEIANEAIRSDFHLGSWIMCTPSCTGRTWWEEKITKWSDLWRPSLKGKIAMPTSTPRTSSRSRPSWRGATRSTGRRARPSSAS